MLTGGKAKKKQKTKNSSRKAVNFYVIYYVCTISITRAGVCLCAAHMDIIQYIIFNVYIVLKYFREIITRIERGLGGVAVSC